jgi:hypothetical protein
MSSAPLPQKKTMVQTARGYFELFCGVGKKVFDFLYGPALSNFTRGVADKNGRYTTAVGGRKRHHRKIKKDRLRTQKKKRSL